MVRTSLSTKTSTSLSSMPGSSAATRTSFSEAFTSTLGHDPPNPPGEPPRSAGAGVEAVEHIVEEPVHLAMKGQERAELLARRRARNRASAPAPGDQIFYRHFRLSFGLTSISAPAGLYPRVSGDLRFCGSGRPGFADLLDVVVLRDWIRRAAGRDLDPARLQGVRHLALQIDGQEAVGDARARDLDVIGEVETLPEAAGRDAAVEILRAFGLGVLLTRDEERVLLLDEFDLRRGEARHRHGDAILVVARLLDVVGWPVRGRGRLIEHVEQPIEADGRPVQGGEVVPHSHILH